MAADGYLFKHIDLEDKRQIPDCKQCMSHILPPDLVTYKTSAKLDKHRDVFFIDPRKLHEKQFFHYIQYRIKKIICKTEKQDMPIALHHMYNKQLKRFKENFYA